MKPLLMYRDRDFDPAAALPTHAAMLMQDLDLARILEAMADGDPVFFDVAKHALLAGLQDDPGTALYRQAVLQDCLAQPVIVRALYNLTLETMERRRREWLGIFSHYPRSILHSSVTTLRVFVEMLHQLKAFAAEHAGKFHSEGFRGLFARLESELPAVYLAQVSALLDELGADRALLSSQLGKGNQGTDYVLRKPPEFVPSWWRRLLGHRPSHFTIHIHPRDDAGSRALGEIEDRGLNVAANALAQSADHVLGFFTQLGAELAFYLGAANLHRRLKEKGLPICFPVPEPARIPRHACRDLRDVALALAMEGPVVGNDLGADERRLIVITGANQGGKSTFLRSVGLAQLMMQCGLFVTAQSFRAEFRRGLFTHYRREEDAAMKGGKLDEELRRMSAIMDALAPDALLLLNESFAATNDREGSEIARQIVQAVLGAGAKVFFVTHLYGFPAGWWREKRGDTLFLRAERRPDGRRTFRVLPGEPLDTSFGADLYQRIVEAEQPTAQTATPAPGQIGP